MSEATRIPVRMLACEVRGGSEKDVRKYITTANAGRKQMRRRMRRLKAFLYKMSRRRGNG